MYNVVPHLVCGIGIGVDVVVGVSVVCFRRSVFKPCIEEGQAFTGHESSLGADSARIRTGSPGQADGDSGYNSGDSSDCSGKGALLDNETPASAAIQARFPPDFGKDVPLARYYPIAILTLVDARIV